MNCKTKNISMFFVHAISFFLLAIIFSANACAGVASDTRTAEGNSGIPFIDTYDQYLASFIAQPVENGLEISVRVPSAEKQMPVMAAAAIEPEPMTAENEQTGQVSVVNRIEFTGLPEGKSTVLLGTTHKIQYEVTETADKKIILNLRNTRLPEHRKRPLITTRFDSAVDRVLPIQTESMKDTIVSVELRQNVAYEIEQADNLLKINFAASTVPPKPLEEAQLPPWRKVIEETLELEKVPMPTLSSTLSAVEEDQESLYPDDAMISEDEIGRLTRPADKYTGEKIALDFFETDIRNVFRILREVSGKNFAIDKDVTGTVTLTLERPVPWDQVLDLILRMNQLGKVEEGDIVRIARMATITQEEEARRAQIAAREQAKQQQIAVEPLMTEYISVNYSDARSEILPHLHNIATKERGSLSVDTRTNMIIMTDTAEKIRRAREIVQRLDMVTPQVIIEARIVEASSTFSKEIGISWSMEGGIQNDDPQAGTGPQRGYDFLGGTWGYDTAVNLPPASRAGSIGFQFSRIFGTPLVIDAKLSAMESLGEGKIVSAPKVMTLNNKKAVIKQGREVPYSVVSLEGVNTEFKEVDLLLEVTPHVTPDDRVALRVKITKDEIAEFTVDGIPSLSTKQAETELLINDGETIVIGGILQTTEQRTTRKVPALGNLPVLGWLFSAEASSTRKEELLIFLTPRIMRLEQKNI